MSDSGPGVPADSLAKLFEPFYRLDDARGRQTGGVGWVWPSPRGPCDSTVAKFRLSIGRKGD